MVNIYIILAYVLIISFITGNVVLFVEHKRKKDAFINKHTLLDEDVI